VVRGFRCAGWAPVTSRNKNKKTEGTENESK
jgi:hypothetical protein